MSVNTIVAVIAIGFSILSGLLVWLSGDARSKTRAASLEEKVNDFAVTTNLNLTTLESRMREMEVSLATSRQDRADLHSAYDRLDEQKASKELVDGLRSEIQNMRTDFDKRFDKLESILSRKV